MKQFVSKIKPEYYIEVEGADELEHISDENVTTVTQASALAQRVADMTGQRVKLRAMNTLAVLVPGMVCIDPLTGMPWEKAK